MSDRLSADQVFTPGKKTTVTYVPRDEEDAVKNLRRLLRRGGNFVAVVGPTKMGKTVLVEREAPDALVLQGQSLQSVNAMWDRLAMHLGIPVTKSSGTVVGDTSKWSFFGRFGISGLGVGTSAGGEHKAETNTGWSADVHADVAVPRAVQALIDAKKKVIVVIDDFHFIPDDARRGLIQALKPVVHAGATVVTITLPHRRADASRLVKDVAGRSKTVEIEPWSSKELERIGKLGFPKLRLIDGSHLASRLANESYGSPQIMQQLCLELCEEVNGVLEEQLELTELQAPSDWTDFFKLVSDDASIEWLNKLGIGPKTRGRARKQHTLADGRTLDGYRVILAALRECGPKLSITTSELDAAITGLLAGGATAKSVNAGAKLSQMSTIAAQSLDAEVTEEDEDSIELEIDDPAAGAPQPVFEYVPDAPKESIHILEPYLAYVLKWHADEILTP